MKDLVDKGKLDKISEKDVYQMREYARGMIRDISRILEKKEKK